MIETQTNRHKGVIPVLFLGVLMGALDISIVGPALPAIKAWFNPLPQWQGWVFSIYVLFNLVGISLFARLSDVWGRRAIYVCAVGIFMAGSVAVATALSFEMLLFGRAIQGFGASGIFPVASAVVGDLYPPQKRGRILGLIGMVFGVAFLIGPLVAGILLQYTGWQMLFWMNVPIALLVGAGALRVLPGSASAIRRKIDFPGIAALALFLIATTLLVQTIDPSRLFESFKLPYIWIFLGLSASGLLSFLILQSRQPDPIFELKLFKNRQLVVVFALAAFTGFIQSSFVFMPNFAILQFGVSFSEASFMLLPIVGASAIGAPLFGRLMDRVGSKKIVLWGLAFIGSGYLWLIFARVTPLDFYLSGVFIGLGLSILAGSSLRYILLNETHASNRAVTQGMLTIFSSLGQMIGGVYVGVWLAAVVGTGGYSVVFKSIVLFAIPAIALALVLKPRRHEIGFRE